MAKINIFVPEPKEPYTVENFRQINITREKIGFKFGEFSFTRAFFRAKLNKKSLK